jgi:hypothetical protein
MKTRSAVLAVVTRRRTDTCLITIRCSGIALRCVVTAEVVTCAYTEVLLNLKLWLVNIIVWVVLTNRMEENTSWETDILSADQEFPNEPYESLSRRVNLRSILKLWSHFCLFFFKYFPYIFLIKILYSFLFLLMSTIRYQIPRPVSPNAISIRPSFLCLDLSSGLFPSDFPA